MYKNPICDRLTQQENSSFFTGSSEAAQGLGWVDLALGFAFLRAVFILRLVVIVIPGVTAGQGKVQKGQNGSHMALFGLFFSLCDFSQLFPFLLAPTSLWSLLWSLNFEATSCLSSEQLLCTHFKERNKPLNNHLSKDELG